MYNQYNQLEYTTRVDRRLALVENVVYYTQALIGDYKYSSGSTSNEFNGWMICDGRSLNKTEYNALYSVILDSFGPPASADTFKIPNFIGRVAGNIGNNGLAPNPYTHGLGEKVGYEKHQLTIPEMPIHTHTGVTDTQGAHNHGGNTGSASAGTASSDANVVSFAGTTSVPDNGDHSHTISTDGAHAHNFTTNQTGGDGYHNNMQPTLFGGKYFIFTGIKKIQPMEV